MASSFVTCKYCSQSFLKDNRHINENNKFGHNFYCSHKCEFSSKNKQVELVCENPSCQNRFKRQPVKISPHNFCSQSCAAIFNNAKRDGVLTHPKIILSDKERKARKFASSSLGGKNRWLNYKSGYTQEYIILQIQGFVSKNGRLPIKREMNKFYRPARKYFGTWNKAIEAAGFTPNPVMFALHHTAKDAHICDSLAEKIIDDYLYERGVTHERNVHYPEGGYTVDFKIGNFWIEYFGLTGGHRRYDELKNIKREIARKHDLNLVEIYPEDLYKKYGLDRIFKNILSPTRYYFGCIHTGIHRA